MVKRILHLSHTLFFTAFLASSSPLCVVFPLSTLILKAAAPDEEDQSSPAPSAGHHLHPRDHGARDIIDFPEINPVSCRYPLLYQIYLDVKKGGGGESNLLCKDVLEDDKNVLKTLVLFLFHFI